MVLICIFAPELYLGFLPDCWKAVVYGLIKVLDKTCIIGNIILSILLLLNTKTY